MRKPSRIIRISWQNSRFRNLRNQRNSSLKIFLTHLDTFCLENLTNSPLRITFPWKKFTEFSFRFSPFLRKEFTFFPRTCTNTNFEFSRITTEKSKSKSNSQLELCWELLVSAAWSKFENTSLGTVGFDPLRGFIYNSPKQIHLLH